MSNRKGILIILLGLLFLLVAFGFFMCNQQESDTAGAASQEMLVDIHAAIEQQQHSLPTQSQLFELSTSLLPFSTPYRQENPDAMPEASLDPKMPEKVVEKYAYIGYLYFPKLGLELPVLSTWDRERLQQAPCRHFGSSRTDDLVIAAHNFETHFGRLKELIVGDEVYFTDMEGIVNSYKVEKIQTLTANKVDEVQNSGYDLVLYTCTKGGGKRVALFCNRFDASSSLLNQETAY